MNDRDPKTMAKALRQALAQRDIEFSYSECLELVARQLGLPDWNVLAAKLAEGQSSTGGLTCPSGWFSTGEGMAQYRIGLDPDNTGVAMIESVEKAVPPGCFGNMMQSVAADEWRGRVVVFSAKLSVSKVEGYGAIWMRIDSEEKGKHLRFENLMRRPHDGALSGDAGWTERRIAFDVPDEAASIHFGFMLMGAGRVSARDFSFGDGGLDLELDGPNPWLPPSPRNLELRNAAN